MTEGSTRNILGVRRQLGYLRTFDKKIEGLRKEIERLIRLYENPELPFTKRSATGLMRQIRGFKEASYAYQLVSIGDWTDKTKARLDDLIEEGRALEPGELDWLTEAAENLEKRRVELLTEIKQEWADELESGRISSPDEVRISRLSLSPMPTSKQPPIIDFKDSALVLSASDKTRKQVGEILARADMNIFEASSDQDAFKILAEEAPDLAVVDADDASPLGVAFLEDLARNPLTDFIPVLKISSLDKESRDDTLLQPIVPSVLLKKTRALLRGEVRIPKVSADLKDVTIREITELVKNEIDKHVVEAIIGKDTERTFDVSREGAVMASLWSLIFRLRSTATEGSKGDIRFAPASRAQVDMLAIAEAESLLNVSSDDVIDEAEIESLRGVKAVVADDDEGVRAAFKKVLEEAGLHVRLAKNGVEALNAITESLPDIVITDILMPEMDGWELTSLIRRDFGLRHLPVIMISWKEDYLQRVQELNAGADDFMLKEADRQYILRRLVSQLKPRFAFEARLRTDGEVVGRIQRLGVVPLISGCTRLRPNSRITVRENWNYFEVDILDGNLVSVTCTSTDGSFCTGHRALERLLSIYGGRFTVRGGNRTTRRQFPEGTGEVVQSAISKLNKMVAQVAGGAIVNIESIELDKQAVKVYSEVIPPKLKKPLDAIKRGTSPREILLDASVSLGSLEILLTDLVRVGAVKKILGPVPPAERLFWSKEPRPSVTNLNVVDGTLYIEHTIEREHTTTIPLKLEDIEELIVPPLKKAGDLSAMDEVAAEKSVRALRIWRTVAIVSIVLLGLLAGIYIFSSDRPESAPGHKVRSDRRVASEPSETAGSKESPTVKINAIDKDDEISKDGLSSDYEKGALTPTVLPSETVAPADTSSDSAENFNEKQSDSPNARRERKEKNDDHQYKRREKRQVENESDREKKRAKRHERTSKNDSSRETRTTAAASGKSVSTTNGGGVLSVGAPPADSLPIAVSVDGRRRGIAPINIKLSPGLHEVVFQSKNGRAMRMVSIKSGQTKSLSPKVAK